MYCFYFMEFLIEQQDRILAFFVISSISMLFLYIGSLIIKNFSLVDFGWSFNFSLIALYISYDTGFQLNFLQILSLVMVWLWSFRLSFYLLFTRILGKPEEGRYVRLRESWKSHLYRNFFLFFQFQGITNAVLSLPFLLLFYQSGELHLNHYAGIFLYVIGLAGETTADLQLYFFKRRPENHNKTLKEGLWKYSRHPNYFFELLIWFSYGVFHLNTPYFYWGFVSFVILLYFILNITGIPATEEQNLSSKGKEYEEYRKTTSPLIPMPPSLYRKLKGV